MSSLKEYIKKHIPETVCICVTALIFISMSVYAIIIYCEMISHDENTFEKIETPAIFAEISEEETDNAAYKHEYYTVGNGTKYHTSDCYYVGSGSKVSAVMQEQIEQYNLEPCSKCIK